MRIVLFIATACCLRRMEFALLAEPDLTCSPDGGGRCSEAELDGRLERCDAARCGWSASPQTVAVGVMLPALCRLKFGGREVLIVRPCPSRCCALPDELRRLSEPRCGLRGDRREPAIDVGAYAPPPRRLTLPLRATDWLE